MANKKSVGASGKKATSKGKKSHGLEQKQPTKKKKLRLHSHLKVNIPLFQSLMMILPSLAKQVAAESAGNSADNSDQVTADRVTEKDAIDDHGKTDLSAVTHQEAQTSDNDVNSTLSASHTPRGSHAHFVPSHHLSALSHPQVHYIPSVSMPTISSGSNSHPTHSNGATTPDLPVTFMPEVIKGTYGELHVDANGQYTFVLNPDSPHYILLNQHQQGTDHFLLHLSNGSSVIVQIPVTGKQDTPAISGDLTGVVTEDHNIDSQGLLHANGKIDVIDPDQNESSVKPEVISGKYGSLTIDADGHWRYQVDNSLSTIQALTEATSLHESFTIHTKDGTPQTIDMTIGGNDDNAVITGVDAGAVTEDLTTHVQGQLSVTDSDLSEDHFQASQLTGNFGTLVITKNGAWTYDLDNTNPAVQALGKGAAATDTITVRSADGTPHQVTITVNGTNDKAIIAGTSSGAVSEESQLQTSGTLTVTDVDAGEAQFSNTDVAGSFGTLHLKDNGTWTYDLDNTNPAVQALGKGAAATDTITVHSADGTPHQVTITVNGTNDKAIIAGTSSGAVTEESQLQTSGTLTVTDVDAGEAQFANTDVAGNLGTLHLTDSGSWTYDLDNTNPAVQRLGQGATATDAITVHSADGTPHQVTITVTGTNDKAVIGGTSSGAVTEESQLHTSGTLTVTDVDAGEAHFSNTDVAGAFGTLHLKDNGAWTYDLDNTNPAVQALGTGAAATDTITVHSADGTPHQVTITVNGTNDKAVIAGTSSGAVTEESQLQTSGTLTVTDVDAGEAQFSNTDVAGSFGTLHLKDNGTWTYDLDNTNPAVQALGKGAAATDTITVHSADGTPHQVTITVNGTNDKAIIAGTSSGAVTEESQLQTSGKLTITDVDTGEAQFSNTDVAGAFGTLHLKDNGSWTYDLDNTNPAVQALGTGAAATDTITVHSADGTPHQVTITVNGTNDKAIIAGTSSGAVTEESQLQTSGKLTITDVDTGEAQFSNTDVAGSFGTLHLKDNGSWTYDLDNTNPAVQALGTGAAATDTITVHSADGTPHQVTITVNGTNDKAIIAGTSSGAVTEESQLQTSGKLTITDVDTGEAQFSNTDVAGAFGTLHLKDNGSWTYDLDNTNPAVQALGTGAAATDTITVHSADGTPHQVTITVNGTNDKAVIGGTNSGAVTEESQLQTSGTLTVTDVDAGEAQFSNTDVAGAFGTLHLKDNGSWTYDLDNTNPAVQALGTGSTATDTITVHSADGTPHQVTITVNGTNDKAIIAGTNSGAVTEESQLQTSGTLTVTDVDAGEAQFSNTDVAGSFGTLHLKDNGSWTYDLDNTNPAVQALGTGATATDTITVHSADGTPHQITVTVNGTNDRPVVSGTSSGAVIEQGLNTAGTPDASGSLTETDLDKSDTITWAINQPQGQWGTLSIDQHGQWHYQLDNSTGGAADKLAAGEHQSESFWITATDSAGATVPHKIVIDVQGSNDKPIVSAWTQLPAAKEDQPVTIKASDLLTHASDVDTSDILHVTNLQATHGSLTDNKDGTYTFTPDKDFNGEIRLTYDVVDGHGGSVSTQAKFDLTATPDNAIITDAQTKADLRGVTEDRGYIDTHYQLHYDGRLNIQDPDAGEAQFDPNIGPQTYQGIGYDTKLGGHILLMRDGHYTYTLDNRNIQNLAQGEVKHDSAVIRSADGTTHTIELTVHGTNDAPTINAQFHSVTEGGSTLKGQMVGHDIDTGATLTYSAPQIDGLVVNPDGSYSFNPAHSTYQSLASGVTKTLTVPVTVTDEHNASSTQNLSITITGVNNSAVIGGVDTGDVTEGNAGQNMSPDYAQPGMAKLGQAALTADGKLNIGDPDSDESQFDTKGGAWNNSYHGQYGHLLLNTDGTWHYHVTAGSVDWVGNRKTTVGTTIDQLGENQTLTDTITVYSKDGTTHDIVITIHGSNDRPYCASEVQLNSGKEDLAQTITATELLANTVDVDANDTGKLTIANLHADHGSIQDNHDGTFTFTPSHNYNGSVHFTYDVKDAHGGTTHTGANTSLVATPDKAIISEVTTGSVIEDGSHATHNNGTTTELANGQLQVIDPDSGEDKFQYSQFGETRIRDPFGGMLRIDSAGNWGYSVDNAALQHLAQGQVETVTYRVHSFDGTAYDLNIDVIGTNDAPTVTRVVLSNGTEDTHYQMQASQFGFTDVDTGDTLHSIAITDLPPAAQGKFVLDGHDITAGQSIATADIAKLQFVPTTDFNGDVQFKFTVNDGHVDSQKATNTLHIDAVSDAAQISGTDTGDVYESTYADRSPDYQRGIISHLWNDSIHTSGKLDIVDHDAGEAHFDNNAPAYQYLGQYGRLILQTDGDWYYTVDVGDSAVGRKIDALNTGENLTDTITVRSADGTTHDVVITIHGDNDAPFASSEVQLQPGKEDQSQTFTQAQLLANSIDVDSSDAGKLSVDNLRADHGSIRDNQDGTYTFTPDHNYNGQVHFTYDVKDAHGGVTHTGASTTLLPSNDAATLQSTQTSNFVTEDHLKSGTSTNELWSGWKNLDIQDIDSPSEAKVTQIEVNGVKHRVPANFAMNLAGAHGTFNFTHSTDGHDKWSYSADNSHAEVQSLSHGESLTDTITLITADGTRIPLTAKIVGTDDHVIIDTPDALTAALGTAVEDKITSISGTLIAHDSDSKDSVTFSAGDSTGAYGTLHVDSNGQWHYDLDHSKANALQQGETKAEGFDITATSTDGSTATKHIEVLVQGSNDQARISVTSNPDVHEDGSSTPVEMISGKLSALDPDHDQSAFSPDVGKRHDPFNSGVHGGLHIAKDGSWTYTVNNSQIQQLAAGQEEHVQYNVHTVGGDSHVIDIKIVGTNDIPTVSATTLAHGTEDTHYQMQASQFGFTDIDTGDTLHSIAITDLPPAAQGKFVLDGHDITAGQSIATADIAKLQFVPATDFNGNVQFKFTVNDGQVDSQEATNTLHIDAVSDAAQISGQLTTEDRSHVTEDVRVSGHMLSSDSMTLQVHDPDSGQNFFIPTGASGTTNAQSTGTWVNGDNNVGQFILHASGQWLFRADNNNPKIDQLGAGQQIQDTITVQSADGTTQQLIAVIHGTNDAPIVSTQVQLAAGQEDSVQVISSTALLANSSDVDLNDVGKLFIDNLHADHGTIVDNKDGTFTFTPDHNYNGQVHFTYDVKDAHGGTTHTGANTSLAAVNDAATITGIDAGSVTEDKNVHPSVQGNYSSKLEAQGQLTAIDPDAGESGFDYHTLINAPSHPNWAPYQSALGGELEIDQQGRWHYYIDNRKPEVQSLGAGETLTDSVTIHSKDGTPHVITLTINGTNDAPVLSVTQTTPTTGTLTETDVDLNDTHTFSVVSSTGQFGSLSVDPDSGAYVYTANGSVAGMSYNSATHTYHGTDVFEVKVADNHGGESSRFITFDANGHVSVVPGQSPTISTSVPANPLVTTTQPSLPTGTNTPPTNAVTVDLAASSDTGLSDTDNLTKDSTPRITGHTDIPYSQVTVYDGSTPIGHAVSDGAGQYSVAVSSLSNGDHNLSAKALAPCSVLPATSSILSLHVDTGIAPLQVSLTHDTGSNSTDLVTNDGSLTITGQEAGATVEYSTDNGHTWTSSFTPQQGSNTVSVRQIDTAGNVSAGTSVSFTLDTTISAPAVSLHNDTGRYSINTPDLITKDSQLSIQTEAGARVEYSKDSGHTWTATFNPVEGVNDLQVRQTDIAGNVSPATHFSFTLDTTPGTVTVNPISQDNALNAAENNQPLVITGTTSNIAPGDVVYVIVGNNHFYDATVKSDGTWSLTLSASAHQNILATDRDYPIQVGTVDTAGNSTPRISTHLLIDTQRPIPHIAVDPVTQDNVLNALESGQTISITGTVTGDYHPGDIVSLKINGATISSLTGSVDASGHFSIPVAGSVLEHANIHTSYANGQSGSIHSIEATVITTDAVGNVGSATTGSQVFSVDTQVNLPTITFENPGPDGLYSKAEIAHGHPNTVTATITPPGDAKVGEHLVVNGQDHVLDAHTLQHGLQIEVSPGSQVQVTMTDEHGNTAGSQGVAASAIPEPIVVKPPSGSHQVSATLGVPPLAPSQTPVPSAQNGWRIHLANGQYVTSHHGQYGTLTIDPQTGHLHYQEQAQVHTGPHGSASGTGQHEDKFEVALQGTNQDEVVAHVNVQILSHGPGHSGKLTIGTEVVDMTITPIVHTPHPAPPPPPVQHDEPEIASHEDFTVTLSDESSLDLSQHSHLEPDQKTDRQGSAAYLDALGIQPNASPTTGHDQPADMDIVLAQVDQQHALDYDQAHLDTSDAIQHHDATTDHNQDSDKHHHNDLDGLPDIDPNN